MSAPTTYHIQQGATGPNLIINIAKADGTVYPLTGATNLLVYFRAANSQIEVPAAGTLTLYNGAVGQLSYTWATADTATVGEFYFIIKMTVGGQIIVPTPFLLYVDQT